MTHWKRPDAQTHRAFPNKPKQEICLPDFLSIHTSVSCRDRKHGTAKTIGIPTDRLPKRIYTGAAGSVTRYFNLKPPVAGGPTTTFVCVDPGNGTSTEMRHWAGRTRMSGRACGSTGSRFMWPQSESIPLQTHVRAPCAGSPQEAALKKELDETAGLAVGSVSHSLSLDVCKI